MSIIRKTKESADVDYNRNGVSKLCFPHMENRKTSSLLLTFIKWPYLPGTKHGEMVALLSAI